MKTLGELLPVAIIANAAYVAKQQLKIKVSLVMALLKRPLDKKFIAYGLYTFYNTYNYLCTASRWLQLLLITKMR
ncbi:hypothetical protein CJD36_009590 [Flavipsychrobacter stenotrophus]|uniref:Uncharacterized protein n=1 Tax=Flavipsychrobacter stenotrophus TaxID=2077091 RepID=A0A2S7SYK7_9BACT|nr:hypothetical protein CJD36_009590 [Flavipsychrobacter stenotrophus]